MGCRVFSLLPKYIWFVNCTFDKKKITLTKKMSMVKGDTGCMLGLRGFCLFFSMSSVISVAALHAGCHFGDRGRRDRGREGGERVGKGERQKVCSGCSEVMMGWREVWSQLEARRAAAAGPAAARERGSIRRPRHSQDPAPAAPQGREEAQLVGARDH